MELTPPLSQCCAKSVAVAINVANTNGEWEWQAVPRHIIYAPEKHFKKMNVNGWWLKPLYAADLKKTVCKGNMVFFINHWYLLNHIIQTPAKHLSISTYMYLELTYLSKTKLERISCLGLCACYCACTVWWIWPTTWFAQHHFGCYSLLFQVEVNEYNFPIAGSWVGSLSLETHQFIYRKRGTLNNAGLCRNVFPKESGHN